MTEVYDIHGAPVLHVYDNRLLDTVSREYVSLLNATLRKTSPRGAPGFSARMAPRPGTQSIWGKSARLGIAGAG